MPPVDPPSEISLRVKVPPGYLPPSYTSDSEQFSIGVVPITTSIGALRAQIQQLVPTHPSPERQRLLYGGRALVDNDQTIGDALNIKRDPTQHEYVVHLLVKGDSGVSRTPTPSSMTATGQRGIGTAPIASPSVGVSADGQPVQPTPVGTPAALLEHQREIARQLEIQQQMMRQHMQAHGNALLSHGFPAFGSHNAVFANAASGPTAGADQQDSSPNGNSGVESETRPPQNPHHLPPNPRVGQGFHMEGVGPGGQRIQVHHQMLNIPGQGLMPAAFNPMGMAVPAPLFPPQLPPRPANAPSALDQARQNIVEIRRILGDIAATADANTQEQQRLREVQERVRRISEYIDPLNVHNANTTSEDTPSNTTGASEAQTISVPITAIQNGQFPMPRNLRFLPPNAHQMMPPPQQQIPPPSQRPGEVTAYLLSSPQGPHALLFSPEYGSYTGTASFTGQLRPTPTSSVGQPRDPFQPAALPQAGNGPLAPPAAVGAPADPVAQLAQQQLIDGVNAQAVQAANGEGDDLLGLQPILGHFWLLIRILVFAYFLLGSNLGWQRPIVLAGIGLGFWLFRAGLLDDGGRVRRWWEGVVGAPRRPQAAGQPGQQQNAVPARQGHAGNAPAAQPAGNIGQAMPTPEQVAQRLMHEAGAGQRGWLREQLRPVERAVALFVASLWPGIGEGFVQEQRRQQEEAEIEARRRAEEEETRKREAEAQDVGGEKSGVPEGSSSGVDLGEQASTLSEVNRRAEVGSG